MAETYCGKSCLNCSVKEEMNCPGCMNGPGMPIKGDCPIAVCCRDKGHNECTTCGLKTDCANFKSRGSQPEFRKENLKAEAEEKAYIAEYAPVMGKWFPILFWFMIIANGSFIFTSTAVNESYPAFYLICSIITSVFTILYGLIFFRLASVHERYTIAGICAMINALYHIVESIVLRGHTPTWFIVIILAAYISMIVEGYHFFNATSDTLSGVDDYLSAKWSDLWKWYKWIMIAMISSVLLVLIIPILGALVLIASLIGIIVVDILKFVYTYKTGKAFKKVE